MKLGRLVRTGVSEFTSPFQALVRLDKLSHLKILS